MSRRWLGTIALLISIAWARPASAAFSINAPDPVVFMSVPVNTTTTTTRMISSDTAPETLDTIQLVGADCGRFAVIPDSSLPQNITAGNMLGITIGFTPNARGTVSCTVNLLTGTTPDGSFMITGTGIAPVITLTPTTINFPDVRVANAAVTTAQQNLRISNSGDAPLTITTPFTFSGAAPSDFSVSTPSLTVIPSGSFTDVAVTFDPTMPGNRTATINISSDDPATPTATVSLGGNGTSALIAVGDLDFGLVTGGSTANGNVVVSNIAGSPQGLLAVSSATITQLGTWFTFGANGSGCASQTTCNFTSLVAPPGAQVVVRCAPPSGATGTQTGMVTFTSDTDGGGDSVAMLSCTAGRPDVMVAPTTLAFGTQLVNTTSSAQQIVVTNIGNSPLHYDVAAFGGTPAAFPITAACTASCTLGAGLSAMIDVAFKPTSPAAVGTTIHVTSDDPDLADMDISVTASGTGIAPQISAAPASLDYASIEVGSSSAMVLTATNTGAAPLTISAASITAGAADYTVTLGTAGMQTVPPSGSATWTIRCNPSAPGPRPGTFRIASDSFTGATTDVALTCTGLQGVLTTTPATTVGSPIDFGGVSVGTTDTRSFILKNSGNVTITGLTGVLAPANVGYTIDPTTPVPAMLIAGETATITVKFAPISGADGGPATITITGSWGSGPTAATVVVFLNGDGLTAGYDVTTVPSTSPPTIDFGSLRWDTTATGFFCIINTDQTPLTIQSPITITPTAPTASSEFVVTSVKRNATCSSAGGSTANLPQTLAQAELLVVTVTADPANRTGAMAATATVTSNLAMMPTRTVSLVAMSTTAMLTTTPGLTVDFGSVDIDGPPAIKTITIANTGDGPLDLSSFARTPTTGPFTIVLPSDQTIAVGAHVDIPVTYTPTVEQAAGAFEQVVLSHGIAGVLNGPAMQMITIKGRGVDRHLAVDAPPVFPDTFRNPGATAPVRAVSVHNTGEATLSISAVMVTNDDVWQLLDGNPVDIPANGSHDFMVRFAPKVAGKAPVGELTFMNNDNSVPAPMAIVLLNGNGLDRAVAMGEPVIDFGYTGIGIPVTLEGRLSVTSMDPDHGFTIRSIDLDDDQTFQIDDPPAGVSLAAQTTMQFTVTFTPTAEGTFETRAHLYLDEDPTVQAEVVLTGTAVFVDVTGGGGCSTGHGTGTGAVLVLAMLALRRRRRRRPRAAHAGVIAGVIACVLAVPSIGRADPNLDLDISLFNPTPTTTGTGFQVQPASVGANGAFAAAATLSYATNPVVLRFSGSEHVTISQRTTMELGAAYAFLDRFEVGIRMPLYNQSGDGQMVGVASPSGTARGDLAVHGKVQLARAAIGSSSLIAGATLAVTLPTATSQEFAGVDNPTARAYGLVTLIPSALAGRLSFTANLGAVIRKTSTLSNINQGSGLAWGVGGSVRMLDALWATGELFGDVIPSGRMAGATSSASTLAPSEYLVGISYRPDRRVSIGLAIGRGLIAGLGTPDLRGVFSLAFVPGTPELAPIHPPPPPKIDGDADGDGIPDSVDRCPDQPEDKDMFDDTDGCPDNDNDDDGFPDATDKCPLDPEDKDGFQDDDGCPDKDNDGDGIPDAQDKCPDQPEDKDGFQDIDGCPDPDNDLDGIVDAQDMCPNEPETINGNQDDDGCPDRGDALVVVTPSAIEAAEAIQFTGSKISKSSTNVLGQIAATLRAHQEIVRLKLVVHVQPTNNSDKDQALSEKRADEVRDWLVQWGIAQTRISAHGMGGQKPLVPRGTKNAQMINDRIEMIILERK